MPTIFTKIINREIPAEIVYETNDLIAIKDINPQALTHILIIPKKEIPTINDLEEQDKELLANMFFAAKKIAKDLKIEEGYKLKFNVGPKGGQEVFHIHLHLLSNL
ncbi:histidine triad nucleotide-binding protein [Candidatus Gracilibacteria bacterium GN02-872]|nr:histidine triad nucleotide-binding protein [Candidatus Gracilibacteria bacterium GN02-872]